MPAVGIDIGATNLRVALADEKGRLLKVLNEKTERKDLMGQICRMVSGLSGFDRIGIASAGLLDVNSGVLLYSANLGIKNLKIADSLEREFGVPVRLLNDCTAAVLGERAFGAGRDVDNLVYVTISSGIGCGVIADGRLLQGKSGNAHEVGHFVIDAEGRMRCGCGCYGHWEAYCSGKNMPNFARYLLGTKYEGKGSLLSGRIKSLTSETLFRLAKVDGVASDIIDEIGRLNAAGFASVINAYDPELITVGGSVALNNKSAVLGTVRKYIRRYGLGKPPKIMATPLGGDIVLYGAVSNALA